MATNRTVEEFQLSALEHDVQSLDGLGSGEVTVSEVVSTRAAPTIPTPRHSLPRDRFKSRWWRRLVSPFMVLVIWQLTHVFSLVSSFKLPPPTLVAATAYNLVVHPIAAFGSLQASLLVSLERWSMGFTAGAIVALALALAAGLNRAGEAAVDPILQMVRTVPLFGLIPLFILWFGIGNLPKVLLIALAAAVPLYLNAYAGIRSIDTRLYELGKVVGISRRELLHDIVLPGALPQALVGLRQSLGASWLALVVAEQIAANRGLGFMINQAATFDRGDVILVALVVYTLLGLLTDWIVRRLERRALAWRTDLVIA
jgi:sulfonate transport system permease protein